MRRKRERIYLSGRFSQQAEFKKIREKIRAMGHGVCSTWLDQTSKEPTTGAARRKIATRDLADVREATLALLDFSLPPRGGRETEHGAFLALKTECWVIGNQNPANVFTSLGLPVADWDEALALLWKETHG